MNCQDCQQQISTSTTAQLQHHQVASAHLHGCPSCQQFYQDLKIQQLFVQLTPVPKSHNLSDNIAKQIQQVKAKHVAVKTRNTGFIYGGIAACFLVLGLILQPMIFTGKQPASIHLVDVAIPLGAFKTVNVMLNSEYDYHEAQLAINMSGGVSFDQNGAIKDVAWQSNINKGKNILPLPVHLLSPSGGEIHVKMSTKDGIKEFVMRVKAKAQTIKGIRI